MTDREETINTFSDSELFDWYAAGGRDGMAPVTAERLAGLVRATRAELDPLPHRLEPNEWAIYRRQQLADRDAERALESIYAA